MRQDLDYGRASLLPAAEALCENEMPEETDRKWWGNTDRGADAARLCALVFSNGKILDRFTMAIEDAAKQTGLPLRRIEEAVTWAFVNGWIRRRSRRIELTAAGIYVAKSFLDLPR